MEGTVSDTPGGAWDTRWDIHRRLGNEPGEPELWTGGQDGGAKVTLGNVLLRRKYNNS